MLVLVMRPLFLGIFKKMWLELFIKLLPIITPIALKILGNQQMDEEQLRAFYVFTQAMANRPNSSKKTRDAFSQINQRLKEKVKNGNT